LNTRTQIYLDDKQRQALKLLAASSDASVSDLVRRAVTRMLNEEFAGKDWATEIDAVVARIRQAGPVLSEKDAIAAVGRRRRRRERVSA